MKTALKVAKTELKTLFYSPIAWFLLIIFLVQAGVTYFSLMHNVSTQQEMGGFYLKFMRPITFSLFAGMDGLFDSLISKLYLFIPLLTMGLISREMNSGTIKLLYSSPIKVHEIIFGKYIAMMIYNLLMVLIVSIFLVSGAFHIKFADTGMLFSGAIGIYLLLLAYSAIGLFMSCLTTYQIVAAVCTFVMIGILTYIGEVWQKVDFIRNITYYLSLRGRADKMLFGLLTSKDVLYFFVIIYIFLGLSIYRLKSGMESKPWSVKALRYAAVIVSAIVIGYIGSMPKLTGYLDLTTNKKNTLSKTTQEIVNELKDAPLKVTVYNNIIGTHAYNGLPEQRNTDLAWWDQYIRFKNDISIRYVQYYDSVYDVPKIYMEQFYSGQTMDSMAIKNIRLMGFNRSDVKTPAEIRKEIDLKPELNRYVMHLEWKDRSTFLRIYDDMIVLPLEAEVGAAFKRLLAAKLPKIMFATGELERGPFKAGDRDYQTMNNQKTFRYSLINQGFDTDTLSLETQDIPKDITALVLADPKVPLSERAKQRLTDYINQGGNLMISTEPGRQEIINPLLQRLGITLKEGQVVQQSTDTSPDLAILNPLPWAASLYRPLEKDMADSMKITMPGAAALGYDDSSGFKVEPLLVTDPRLSWNKKAKLDLDMAVTAEVTPQQASLINDGAQPKAAAGTVSFNVAEGDERGSFPTMLRLTRMVGNKEQRVIVCGDADFMSSTELGRQNIQTANFTLSTGLFRWLSYNAFPIDAFRPEDMDKRLNISIDEVEGLKIIYVWIVPAICIAFATILLIRRKRK